VAGQHGGPGVVVLCRAANAAALPGSEAIGATLQGRRSPTATTWAISGLSAATAPSMLAGHVLAGRVDDQVFLAADDGGAPVGVDCRQEAGALYREIGDRYRGLDRLDSPGLALRQVRRLGFSRPQTGSRWDQQCAGQALCSSRRLRTLRTADPSRRCGP
jgi:hypothetical protein